MRMADLMKAGSDAGQATLVALCHTRRVAAVGMGQLPLCGPLLGWTSHLLRKGSVILEPQLILCKRFLSWYMDLCQHSVAAQSGGCRAVFGLNSPVTGLADAGRDRDLG